MIEMKEKGAVPTYRLDCQVPGVRNLSYPLFIPDTRTNLCGPADGFQIASFQYVQRCRSAWFCTPLWPSSYGVLPPPQDVASEREKCCSTSYLRTLRSYMSLTEIGILVDSDACYDECNAAGRPSAVLLCCDHQPVLRIKARDDIGRVGTVQCYLRRTVSAGIPALIRSHIATKRRVARFDRNIWSEGCK